MATKSYEKGRNYEYYLMNKLEKAGFFVVRSAGSHGVFDLIAVDFNGTVYGIQVKKNGYLQKSDIEMMKQLYRSYKIIPLLAHNKNNNGWEFELVLKGDGNASDS